MNFSVHLTYYHRGSNCGSSTRGTAHTRYVFIGCCDSGNNPDSNACQIYWRKYIWTPLRWKLVLSCDEVTDIYILYTLYNSLYPAAYKVFTLHIYDHTLSKDIFTQFTLRGVFYLGSFWDFTVYHTHTAILRVDIFTHTHCKLYTNVSFFQLLYAFTVSRIILLTRKACSQLSHT